MPWSYLLKLVSDISDSNVGEPSPVEVFIPSFVTQFVSGMTAQKNNFINVIIDDQKSKQVDLFKYIVSVII